ncbi:MAG: Na+/H+ antiporter NhaC family protein [Clostridia bacterium]|nr:Na+/H+ antiporter NhaC family protein [Clostridia bacterium]
MFKKYLKFIIAFACVAAVLIAAGISCGSIGTSAHTVDCGDCGALGYVLCDCGGVSECEACAGAKTYACETCGATGSVTADSALYSTVWSLIPPVVAIFLALITKEAYSSLFIGILVGGLFSANFAPVGAWDAVINSGFIGALADSWNAGIFIFLVLLGIIVALINQSGGAAAFGRWATKNIKTRVGAMLATFVLGVLIFVDDYFNCLTVGSVMTPITDRHKISRAKLAYIIDATAAPICMIAPVSSWAAAVSSVAAESGGAYSGIELFCRAIPYNFYSLLTFVFVIGLVLMKMDYGPMKLAEMNALVNGELGALKAPASDDEEGKKGIMLDLLLPIIVLIIFCVLGMIYVGGFFDGANLIDAFGDTDASVGLPYGAMIALIITVVYLIARKAITFKQAMEAVPKGFIAMVPAILILTFSLTLKNITGLLGADAFVAGAMENAAGGLQSFLPAIIVLVACFLAFSTGTSWGTFGILIPIVTAVFDPTSPLYIIGISACLAGAVCGDHCSPISDTTIMASAGANCEHVSHVSTQLPYAITVAGVSFVAYILAGFIRNAFIVLPIAIVLMIATLFVIKFITKKNEAK